MLCWPMFSSGNQGGFLAAMVPGFNAFKLLLLGLEMRKDEKAVKLMSGLGDHCSVLNASFYYLTAISLASVVYWRTSPVAVAAVCNLCIAPIVGRRFGSLELPYNRNKSVAGTFSMVAASFLASIWYMQYFSIFGYLQESWKMVYKFFVVSLVAGLGESHPYHHKT
ncbi:unnamed protein product [Coffea canephora]|uniref:Uncharacterized protein n=1 Tax=Coffea canephora TaxID=49390 RepID=A0A068UBK9_COFCA|nr:unnamed protein product [Coffea canephora]